MPFDSRPPGNNRGYFDPLGYPQKNGAANGARSGDRQVLSVSDLNRQAKRLLEVSFPSIWVEGELSNIAQPRSGHWYFTLKDAGAQVRCAMFRGSNAKVRFRPQEGQLVLIRAKVSLYEGRGDYQLIAEHMEEAGTGALQRAFEELKNRLSLEGLFAQELKKPLPTMATHVAVVTSPTGAAIQDILTVFKRRFPAMKITVLPSLVQGAEAAPQIIQALALAARIPNLDAVIVGRGGGSLEDLWPFNEESVARAIADCPLPVVSAVGHEVDFTIADFVADHRAPTPSAAAGDPQPRPAGTPQYPAGLSTNAGPLAGQPASASPEPPQPSAPAAATPRRTTQGAEPAPGRT